ncbi:MAG: hypothetical protein NVV67_07345 [Pseudoxanthomonas sp.]|nr:hypothetical protein [Pseudoxanthomonas sp.]
MAKADTDAANEEIVMQAKRRQDVPNQASAASRTKNIRGNRAAEKEANREVEVFRPGQPSSAPERPSAEVLPFPGKASLPQLDYSLPSIDEILGADDDDE